MADYNAMTKTRPNSSESPAESPESMGCISRGVNASPSCYSDVLNASQTGYAKKEFIMMAPEEKLKHFNRRAQACEDNQEFDACIQDLVRCVALTRLVYGDGHLKLAQAHARLAQAYFQFNGDLDKGYPVSK
nr:tetratricopeptide repeat protein 23-like [Pseudochaenichthys georgianus]